MARKGLAPAGDDLLAAARRLSDEEIVAQIPAARVRAAEVQRRGVSVTAARYRPATRSLAIELVNGTRIEVPIARLAALQHASPRELAKVEVTPSGLVLHWERLDVDLGVLALIRDALGDTAMSALGSAGGQVTSERKAQAARENGAKGGRPPGRLGAKPVSNPRREDPPKTGYWSGNPPKDTRSMPARQPRDVRPAATRAGVPVHAGVATPKRAR